MQKNNIKYIAFSFCLLTLLALPSRMQAQHPNNSIDTNFFMAVDAANYDSLLHNFYMQQYVHQARQHSNRRATQAYAEFDKIPDSVFIKRLHQLHTVIPLTYNNDVRAYIKLYVRIMSRRLDAMLSLSSYYFPMFEETLDRYGVPAELKYLTIVESALNPQATSRAGAAGLWQFMYATGKNYDLEVNSLVDERRDPYKSTVAAARYLKALYSIYDDWFLAMAAYNCGPGNVNKAIARSGGKKDFWQIYYYLPRETRGYIPAYIGAYYAMNYYHEHGMTAGRYTIPVKVDTIHLHHDVHFSVVEHETGIPIEQLRQLNPQYRADIIPASSRRYVITIPTSKMSTFLAHEDSIYKSSKDSISKRSTSTIPSENIIYHKVRKGETFSSIAKKYGVSVTALKRWNGMGKKSTLKVGVRLKIHLPETESKDTPAATAQVADSLKAADTTVTTVKKSETTKPAAKSAPKPANTYYTVRKGDNLSTIATRHKTTVANLKKLNNLKSDKIQVGQRLKVK